MDMNNLTPEQLDMIKRLQPLFKKKMGEWQEGEEGFCIEHRRAYIDNCPFAADKYSECDGEQLRIPKPIDWQNPERGLWGMIKKGVNKQIEETDAYCFVWIDSVCFEATDPFTALLMALCVQEGV
jgi:hypothetical protein